MMTSSKKVAELLWDWDALPVHFLADVDGHRADVDIVDARIEWSTVGGSSPTEVIPVSAITAVRTARAGLRKSKLMVTTVAETVTFRLARGTAALALAVLAQLSAKAARRRPIVSIEPFHVAPDGTAERLINLKWFLDVGILTEAEFNEHRARLLGYE